MLKVWSLGDLESTGAGARRSASSMASSAISPESHFLERQRLRPAGASLSRARNTASRAPRYWETGNEDPTFRYNNYLEPLSLAAHRCDGCALRLSTAREGRARSDGDACSACPASSASPVTRWRTRILLARSSQHPPLLRDRCPQHLPRLPPLRAHARQFLARALCRGSGTREALLRGGTASEPHFTEYLRAWETQA